VKWQAVFFDFDGVIVDSVPTKGEAFAELFREFGPEIEKKVVEYHFANGGISREEKFKYFFKEFLRKPLTQNHLTQLCQQFSDLVLEKVITAPFLPGVLDALEQLKKDNTSSFVVSGTPQDEIRYIVEQRDLSKYFQGVYGSPRKKGEIIKELLDENNLSQRKCLFIGDSLSDYEGAKETGVFFLGIVPDLKKSIFPQSTHVSSLITLYKP
tara:strand:- start:863 stop:1495 length:633 start_codon:yes stop_codon:yes gene_type:complete